MIAGSRELPGAAKLAGLGALRAGSGKLQIATAAGITLHVRLLNGTDSQHVLDAIFKALGVALAQACRNGGEGRG